MKSPTPPWTLAASLLLAAVGQAFMVQQDKPWTLVPAIGCTLAALFLFHQAIRGKSSTALPGPSPRAEGLLVTLLLMVALFFRVFRLDQFPAGIFPDDACAAYGALRILHEGWRPFHEVFTLHAASPSVYYRLALWFDLFPATRLGFFAHSVTLSMATLAILYFTFRRLAGVRVACTALFILAVMRWDVTFSRNGHLNIEVPFYLAGALFFWVRGLTLSGAWDRLACGLFLAAGLYGYTAFFAAIPLFLLYALYERYQAGTKPKGRGLALVGLTAGVLALPMLWHILRYPDHGNLFGASQDTLGGFLAALAHGQLGRIPSQLSTFFLSFVRQGDPWYLDNLPGHRLLDDATAVLGIFGLALAWTRRQERPFFYALAGAAVMALPALLSSEPEQSGRALGAAPFLALLAALALTAIGEKLAAWKGAAALVTGAALGLMAFQNYGVYFNQQAKDPDCWRGPAADVTQAAEKIRSSGSLDQVYIASKFFGSYGILFLDHDLKDRLHPLELNALPAPSTPAQALLFMLDEGKSGVMDLLEGLYPGGVKDKTVGPDGRVLFTTYFLPWTNAWVLPAPQGPALPKDMGLTGVYYQSLEMKGSPAAIRRDPVLNFTFRNDFPFTDFPPLTAQWKGKLLAPKAGTYRFLALSTDFIQVEIDGKKLLGGQGQPAGEIRLTPGAHALAVFFQKEPYRVREEGQATALTLLWQRPGEEKYEVVPYRAFRQR